MISRLSQLAVEKFFNLDMTGSAEPGGLFRILASKNSAPKRETADFLKAYSTRPWLATPVDRISTDVAATQWRLMATRGGSSGKFVRNKFLQRAGSSARWRATKALSRSGELEEIDDHPFLDLLDRMNPALHGWGSLKVVSMGLETVGEGGFMVERHTEGPMRGLPMCLWPLPAHWIKATPTGSSPFWKVELPNTPPTFVPASEIVWLKYPDPGDPYGRGSGPARSLADELDIAEYAGKLLKATFFNRGRPDILITSEAIKTQEQADQLEAKWVARSGSFWRTARPMFLSFQTEVKEISQTFDQLQVKDLIPAMRDSIIQRFGVSPEILGIVESSNRATSLMARINYGERVLLPRVELLRQVLQWTIVMEYDERLVLDYDSPVPDDMDFQLDVMKAAPWNFKRNQFQELAGFEPLPDDLGEVFMVPVNLIPMDAGAEAQLVEEGKAKGGVVVRRLMDGVLKGRFTDEDPTDPYWLAANRVADRMEPRIRRLFLNAVDALTEHTQGDGLEILATALRSGNVEGIVGAIDWSIFESSFAGEQLERTLEIELYTALRSTGELAAEELSGATGLDVSFDEENTRARNAAATRAATLVRETTDSQKEAVRQLTARGFEQGLTDTEAFVREVAETIGLTSRQEASVENFRQRLIEEGASDAQIEQRVRRFRNQKIRLRGVTIARTETVWSAVAGQHELWKQVAEKGIIPATRMRRFWITTPDDRLCEVCEPMPYIDENQNVELNGLFTLGDFSGQVLHSPAHPLCRCGVGMTVLKEEPTRALTLPGSRKALANRLAKQLHHSNGRH